MRMRGECLRISNDKSAAAHSQSFAIHSQRFAFPLSTRRPVRKRPGKNPFVISLPFRRAPTADKLSPPEWQTDTSMSTSQSGESPLVP
jgi:hypothetical protein